MFTGDDDTGYKPATREAIAALPNAASYFDISQKVVLHMLMSYTEQYDRQCNCFGVPSVPMHAPKLIVGYCGVDGLLASHDVIQLYLCMVDNLELNHLPGERPAGFALPSLADMIMRQHMQPEWQRLRVNHDTLIRELMELQQTRVEKKQEDPGALLRYINAFEGLICKVIAMQARYHGNNVDPYAMYTSQRSSVDSFPEPDAESDVARACEEYNRRRLLWQRRVDQAVHRHIHIEKHGVCMGELRHQLRSARCLQELRRR
jgi:hypothetical protein